MDGLGLYYDQVLNCILRFLRAVCYLDPLSVTLEYTRKNNNNNNNNADFYWNGGPSIIHPDLCEVSAAAFPRGVA